MSGARYQYDEQGLYFYYFVASTLGLVVAPSTYYLLTAKTKGTTSADGKEHKTSQWDCECDQCARKKAALTRAQGKKSKTSWTYIALALGWILFLFFVYKAATTRPTEAKLWDPFEILGISEGSEASDVRRAFRKLSLRWHPDKVEPEEKDIAESKYIEISKAYKALTDDEARKNWEEFGHPDGKQAISLGIALPSWLVEAGSKYKVLALYGIVFGIILPLIISRWWQQSKILTKDQILTGTMDRFAIEMKPGLKWSDLMILVSAAQEFKEEKAVSPDGTAQHMTKPEKSKMQKLFLATKEVVEDRFGDKLERPKRLMTDEAGWKAYLLLTSHIYRVELEDQQLEDDRRFVVVKAGHLLTGMMHVAISRWSLPLVDSVISLGQVLVQAAHPMKMGPLFQLPYMTEEILKHTKTKKRNIQTIKDVCDMPDSERRDLFRTLSDEQYKQLVDVAMHIPQVSIEKVVPRVIGEKDIEVNALITVFVKVKMVVPALKAKEDEAKADEKKDDAKKADGAEKKEEDKKEDEFGDEEEHVPEWWEKRDVMGDPAHAPYWPTEKQTGWWVVLTVPHMGSVVTKPIKITDLKDERTVRLVFYGPREPGTMQMAVFLRSDAYQGCDRLVEFRFPIKPASQRPPEEIEDDISEPDEDTFAGQLALARKELAELGGSGKPTKKKVKSKVKGGAAAGKSAIAAKAQAAAAAATAASKKGSPASQKKEQEAATGSDSDEDSSDDSDLESETEDSDSDEE